MSRRNNVPADPAKQHNDAVLADIEVRNAQREIPVFDLGLGLQEQPAGTADDFFRDEFDRKAFGEVGPMYSRTVYGPDPLIDNSPQRLEIIERMGLQDYAEEVKRAIIDRGAATFDEPTMRSAVGGAIRQFGAEKVATAFAARILRIPSREVYFERSDDPDLEVSGSKVMSEILRRYSRPGMAYKFLSEFLIKTKTTRGYQVVMDNGEPVRCGTLVLGEISEAIVRRRRDHNLRRATESIDGLADQFTDTAARIAHDAGAIGVGSGPLRQGENVQNRSGSFEHLSGEIRPVGIFQETL